jgi:ribosomal protein L29
MSESEDSIHQRLTELINHFEGGVQARFAKQVGIETGIVESKARLRAYRKNLARISPGE